MNANEISFGIEFETTLPNRDDTPIGPYHCGYQVPWLPTGWKAEKDSSIKPTTLARKGCAVAICGRRPEDVEGARAELLQWGSPVHGEVCDLRRRDDVERFIRNVAARLGDVDVLVTNAATISVAPLEALDATDFERAMRSIFETALHASLAVIPSMRARTRSPGLIRAPFGQPVEMMSPGCSVMCSE